MVSNIDTSKALIGIIVVLVIIILVQYLCSSYELYGLWSADSVFLIDANLNNMSLFIGDKIHSGALSTTYGGYIYADTDSGAVEDQRVELTLTYTPSTDSCKWYSLKAKGIDSWEGDLQMRICPKKHLLTVLTKDTVYAELYKDNILTDYARSTPQIDAEDDSDEE